MADLTIKRGDTSPPLTATIIDPSTGTAANLTGGSVTFVMRALTAITTTINASATIVTPSTGAVSYTFTATDTATAGKYMAEFHVTTSGGSKYTWPTDGWLEIVVEEDLISGFTPRLVSVTEVKDHLRLPASNHLFDNRLVEMIDAVRPVVEGITGPILPRRILNETYEGGNWFILLRSRPVVSVEAVVEYRGPIPYNLTQVPTPDLGTIYSYTFEPSGRLVRRSTGGGITPFPPGANQVFVSYTAGFAVVPSNVREAALELIRENFQQTEMFSHSVFGGSSASRDDEAPAGPASGFYVTDRVRELLEPNKRAPSVA